MFGSSQWMYASGGYELEQSLRFEDSESPYLKWTPESAGNRRTWTFSAWVKRANSDNTHMLFFTAIPSDLTEDDHFGIRLDSGSSSNIILTWGDGNIAVTNAIFRDPSAWMHIVVAIDTTQATATDRVKVYINGTEQTFSSTDLPSQNWEYGINKAQEHNIGSRSVYQSASSNHWDGYLAEVHFIDGQSLDASYFGETGTYGEWKPKEYSGSYGTNGFYLPFKQDYSVEGFSATTYGGHDAIDPATTQNYFGGIGFKPDFLWIKNRTKSAGEGNSLTDRVRGVGRNLKTNNTDAEETPGNHIYSIGTDGFVCSTEDSVGADYDYVAWAWDMGADSNTGFGATLYRGQGEPMTVGGFGFSPDLVWVKHRTVAYGNKLIDSVRGAGLYIETNASNGQTDYGNIMTDFTSDGFLLGGNDNSLNSDGAQYIAYGWDMGGSTVTNTDGSVNSTVRANPTYGQSIAVWDSTSGTHTIGHGLNSAPEMVLIKDIDGSDSWVVYNEDVGNGAALYLNSDMAAYSSSSFFNSTSPTSEVVTIGTGAGIASAGDTMVAYCFHSVTGYSKIGSYTGNGGSSDQTITLGFRPAWIMFKRTDGVNNWVIYDSTRQPVTNDLNSNLYADLGNAEATNNDWGVITDTGFILQDDIGAVNENGGTYIYMAFAGGQDSIADFNTDGSLYSRVKANPTYGQSIVSYTGNGSSSQSVGHGLSSAPEMIIVKCRTSTDYWGVYHKDVGTGKYLRLDSTNAATTFSGAFPTTPTATTFPVEAWDTTNRSSESMIAYCFHSVSGYSKFGSWTGNGTSTGPEITTGFKPGFIMWKRTDTTNDWYIIDTTRDPSSQITTALLANDYGQESNYSTNMDILSDGFQPASNAGHINASGGTYIYMAFADTREYAYWLDQSGNNNDWTATNLTESDIMLDTPTNNFPTLNPLYKTGTSTAQQFKEGNLWMYHYSGGNYPDILSTMTMPDGTGKYYCEHLHRVNISGQGAKIGIRDADKYENPVGYNPGYYEYEWYVGNESGNGIKRNNNTSTSYGTFQEYSSVGFEITSIAYDSDNGKVWFARNGVWEGDPAAGTGEAFSGISGNISFAFSDNYNGSYHSVNFGQDSSFAGRITSQGYQDGNGYGDFYYEPPTGFVALCTANLPEPTVVPSEHFNTVLWTGDGSSSRAITGVGFQPDFVWEKSRSDTDANNLVDAIRGVTKIVYSNATSAEVTDTDRLLSFDSDGFTIGSDLSWNDNTPHNYVAWNWKGGNGTSSNSDGSITSTVSANPDAGFSIVSYTGDGASDASIGHGLSSAPEIVFYKNRIDELNWLVLTTATGTHSYAYLNLTNHFGTAGQTAPSSTLLYPGSSTASNGNGDATIAYCFHSVPGYSKIGSYVGNGNADGTFVYTGFKPAWVLIKYASDPSSSGWFIQDNIRSPYNAVDAHLMANLNNAESTTLLVDYLSNGFKIRNSYAEDGTNQIVYAYMAFAETPFKYSNAR